MPHASFFQQEDLPLNNQPNIGLDPSARQFVVSILNLLLADETVLLLNFQHADEYPDLLLYDEQCKRMEDIVIEISERIRMLGGSPIAGSEELTNAAMLDGRQAVVPGKIRILAQHEALVRFLREDARKCSEVYDDQGTFALLVSAIRIHEKMAWMLRSNLENEQHPVHDKSQKRI